MVYIAIFLDLMEYANQIQELTKRSVSGCTFGCTQSIILRLRLRLLSATNASKHLND